MTWMQKARQEKPEWTDEEIMNDVCPPDCGPGLCPENGTRMLYCDECWDREVPPEWQCRRIWPDYEDIHVAGPVYEPDAEEGLTEAGPDRT